MQTYGFGRDQILVPGGREHHDLIVFTKPGWKLPCTDAACGYIGVYLHFECEDPGTVFIHCELYPRQGSESKHDQSKIQPLLELKGGLAAIVRDQATADRWSERLNWVDSRKNLSVPRNLQVGKFVKDEGNSTSPESFVRWVEEIIAVVAPRVDSQLVACATEEPAQ